MSELENQAENGSTESAGECTAGEAKDDKGLGLGVIFFYCCICCMLLIRHTAVSQVALFKKRAAF